MRALKAAILATLFPVIVKAQLNDSVRVYIDSAINMMQRHSLYAEDLNWKVIRDSAHSMAARANTYEEAAPALQFAFNLLQDKHGWLVLGGQSYVNPFMLRDNSRINEATLKKIKKPEVCSERLNKQVAYLSIPSFGGQTTVSMNAFAQKLQDSLCKVILPATKGLIVDLRLNGGGNMYPMIVGISNVLGNGKFIEFVNSRGEVDDSVEMKDFTLTLLDTMLIRLQKNCGRLDRLPVAVLIGPATGSSGEQLAIILSTRKNTILIGEPTAGYVTANNGFLLPGRNHAIVMGQSYTRDKNGQVYKANVAPAIVVAGGDNFEQLNEDLKVKAALRWLNQLFIKRG